MARYSYRGRRPIRDMRVVRDDVPAAPPVPSVPEPTPEPVDYGSLLKSELIELAEQRGIDASGTRADIIARLADG